jgi:hypothetical protein
MESVLPHEHLEQEVRKYYKELAENDEKKKADVLGYLFNDILKYDAPPKPFSSGGWIWVARQMEEELHLVSRLKESVKSELKRRI